MMDRQDIQPKKRSDTRATDHRSRLLDALPITEHRMVLAGIETCVCEGGEGDTIMLLHGPGENVFWWMRVIPGLVNNYRVIVPDLPGHGETRIPGGTLEPDTVFNWLDELISRTTSSPPILVGHLLGGAIAARYAIEHDDTIDRLILVNALGLAKFRPSPAFAYRLFRFMIHPTRNNFDRFLPHCMYDPDDLRTNMGAYWNPFIAYNMECARDADHQTVQRTLMSKVALPKIPTDTLASINVPTALIWGRHDEVNSPKKAQKLSARLGWPLRIIEETRDDPKLEKPEAFLQALEESL